MSKQYWTVDTEQVKNSAEKVNELIGKYATEYEKLYSAITDLRSAKWTGVASDQFNTKLETYKESFEELKSILTGYYDFLVQSANAYESTESSIQSDAGSLPTGN